MTKKQTENWMDIPIPGCEHEVSNFGRVRRRRGTFKRYDLTPQLDKEGHPYVMLLDTITGQFRPYYIWRLVAATFGTPNQVGYYLTATNYDPNEPQPTVEHQDGNKLNNTPSNINLVAPLYEVVIDYDEDTGLELAHALAARHDPNSASSRRKKFDAIHAAWIKWLAFKDRKPLAEIRDWLNDSFDFETPVTYQNVRAVVKGRTYKEVVPQRPQMRES